MAPKSKSIFRQPDAKHFQLVHRSQRDPLINDPEASQHVLKEVERGNVKKGKSRADLEQVLSPLDLAHDAARKNIGQAAAYGIYYDDTDYDYMQHLRLVGVQEDDIESILIEAPSKAKGKAKQAITLADLPAEALPSANENPRNYESQQAVPSSIAGFQPDMDPHLRQVLEALEDEEFVNEDADDDFFGELVAGGTRDQDEDIEFEFREEGIESEEGSPMVPDGAGNEEGWEARFARFKKTQQATSEGSDLDFRSEDGDTIGTLPQFSVIGGKRRRKGASSDASGYSMSSSSMFRNEGLTTLDERFEQIQKEYDSDEDILDGASDSDSVPELITSREDFDAMMNGFLNNYEILGGKMKPVLSGETPMEKLETIRQALGEATIRDADDDDDDDNDDRVLMPVDLDEKVDRWDCETILTTYSNLENHPRIIRARTSKPTPKIELDLKTGLPLVNGEKYKASNRRIQAAETMKEEEEEELLVKVTTVRFKNESKEEKKARKQAVKSERQARRVEKKTNKQQFSSELRYQTSRLATTDKKMRKL